MNQQAMMQLGRWMSEKWAARIAESGGDYFTVATQMRKQGVPLHVALLALLGDPNAASRVQGEAR